MACNPGTGYQEQTRFDLDRQDIGGSVAKGQDDIAYRHLDETFPFIRCNLLKTETAGEFLSQYGQLDGIALESNIVSGLQGQVFFNTTDVEFFINLKAGIIQHQTQIAAK